MRKTNHKTKNINEKRTKLGKELGELTIPKFKDVMIDLRTTIFTTIILTTIIFGINSGIQEILRLILK